MQETRWAGAGRLRLGTLVDRVEFFAFVFQGDFERVACAIGTDDEVPFAPLTTECR